MALFFLDHHVTLLLRAFLETAGHQAVTARGWQLERAEDARILMRAAQAGAIIVSHDGDFRTLHAAWHLWPRSWGVAEPPQHAGILILPQFPKRDADRLAQLTLGALDVRPQVTNQCLVWHEERGWIQTSRA